MTETNETKFIRVYPEDADRLEQLFGKPQWDAFQKAMLQVKKACPHPEEGRIYTSGIVPKNGNEAVNENASKNKLIHGYYCITCSTYIFPSLHLEVEA